MRDGFNTGVKSKITQGHPLEQHYLDWEKQREELNYTIKRQTYGLHAPLRLKMEKALLSQVIFGFYLLSLNFIFSQEAFPLSVLGTLDWIFCKGRIWILNSKITLEVYNKAMKSFLFYL